jgi:hypothetical protein
MELFHQVKIPFHHLSEKHAFLVSKFGLQSTIKNRKS